jgi:membrane associated rhomboid family serine protease
MPSQVLIRLLLWAVALNAGLLLLVMWRRGLAGQYGYAGLLALEVVASGALLYTGRTGHPLSVVVIGTFVFLVVVPIVLRGITAWAVRHGRWRLAMRLTGLRALLQPGAGVGREKELLQVIQQVQSGDTDELVARLRARAAAEEDPELRGLLHEQVLTLLVIEKRWDEALELAAEQVTPRDVAARPRLGAALIRVYGEVGDMDGLVRTMYLVEGGSGAADVENADVLEHCRIMVLAFTGQSADLERLLGGASHAAAEPKVRHFWRGVAHQQAGEPAEAAAQYRLARARLSAEDSRARETIEARLADVEQGCAPVQLTDPDQVRRLVGAIRERAARTVARPRLRGSSWRRTPATIGLVLVNVVIFGAMELFGRGSGDSGTLIRAGASLTHAVHAGEYWRLASAMFLHANWLHLAVNVFMLHFLGRFFEQLVGGVRFFVVYFLAGVAGNLASYLWRSGPVSVGASSSIFGILGGALVVLLLSRGKVPESWRRSMIFVLALVIGLNFLPGLDIKVIDNFAHLGGLVGGAAAAAVFFRTGGGLRRGLTAAAGLACVAALLYCAWGLVTSDLDRLPWARSRAGSFEAHHPVTWFAVPNRGARQLELVDLVGRDQVIVVRAGRADVASLEALLARRWQELGASESRAGPGRAVVRRPLPRSAFPAGWVGFRRDVREPSGSRYVEVRAFGLFGPPRQAEEWQALLYTRGRLDRALPVFVRILRSLRPVPR